MASTDLTGQIYDARWSAAGGTLIVGGGEGMLRSFTVSRSGDRGAALEAKEDLSIRKDDGVSTPAPVESDDSIVVSTSDVFIRKIVRQRYFSVPPVPLAEKWDAGSWSEAQLQPGTDTALANCTPTAGLDEPPVASALNALSGVLPRNPVRICAASLSGDGRSLVALHSTGRVGVYSVPEAVELLTFAPPREILPYRVSVSDTGELVAIGAVQRTDLSPVASDVVLAYPIANTPEAMLSLIDARVPIGVTPEIADRLLSSSDVETLQKLERIPLKP